MREECKFIQLAPMLVEYKNSITAMELYRSRMVLFNSSHLTDWDKRQLEKIMSLYQKADSYRQSMHDRILRLVGKTRDDDAFNEALAMATVGDEEMLKSVIEKIEKGGSDEG